MEDQKLPGEIQNLVDNTTFVGYAVMDYDGLFGTTPDVTKAVAWANERSKYQGIESYVKMFYVYTKGEYAEVPGLRGARLEDWEDHMRQLMR